MILRNARCNSKDTYCMFLKIHTHTKSSYKYMSGNVRFLSVIERLVQNKHLNFSKPAVYVMHQQV